MMTWPIRLRAVKPQACRAARRLVVLEYAETPEAFVQELKDDPRAKVSIDASWWWQWPAQRPIGELLRMHERGEPISEYLPQRTIVRRLDIS